MCEKNEYGEFKVEETFDNSQHTQIQKIFDNLKVAPGIGAFVKCTSCNRFIGDPGEEEMTLSQFVKTQVYEDGWRFGYFKDNEEFGIYCPQCSSGEDFVETTK